MYINRRPEKGIVITPPRKSKDEFYWNPSITRHKGEIYISLRGYTVDSTIWGHWRSTLAVGKLENDKLVGLKVLQPENQPDDFKSYRLEDVRIFSDGKNLMGIGNHLSKRPSGRINQEQALATIDYEKGTYYIDKMFGNPFKLPEKNWSPIDGKPDTFLHSIGKLTRDGWFKYVEEPTSNISQVHNGTPLIKIGNEYIGIFHQRVKLLKDVNRYTNVFIKFDKDFKPIERTGWFVFDDESHQEVQFISGMVLLDEETLGITVGIDRILGTTEADYKGLLYKVKLKDIIYKPFNYNFQIHKGILQ